MEHHSFFPRSTRNRIALMLGLLSLILFFTWNLMPHYKRIGPDEYQRAGFVYDFFWPRMARQLKELSQFIIRPTMNYALEHLVMILLILQIIVMFSIIPAWKLWQSTLLLRLIPAILICICCLIVSYFAFNKDHFPWYLLITNYILRANIFTTALSLLCFKNEYTEPETPH